MIFDDIIDIIKGAQYPQSFPSDLNIGVKKFADDRSSKLLEFFPSDNCSAFANIRQYQDNACVSVHTHGIEVTIDGTSIYIHNSQIIVFECYYFDDKVEFQRSDSRGARVGMGMLLAGPIGAAVGLASSFGKGNKHITSHNLIIAFWDIETQEKEIIELEDRKGVKENAVPNLIEYWKEQIKINEETGRKAVGDYKAGVKRTGCLGILLPVLCSGLYLCYKFVETIIC